MGIKVLLIEDDVNIASALQAKFKLLDINTFRYSQEGGQYNIINQIHETRPDCVLLELLLTQYNGFDLLQVIRGGNLEYDLPVFIFTSLGDDETRASCATLGANYFFKKSEFTIDELTLSVKKIITNQRKLNLSKQ